MFSSLTFSCERDSARVSGRATSELRRAIDCGGAEGSSLTSGGAANTSSAAPIATRLSGVPTSPSSMTLSSSSSSSTRVAEICVSNASRGFSVE